MSRDLTPWQKHVQSALRRVPKGSSRAARGHAMKEAARSWRNMKGAASLRGVYKRNPSLGGRGGLVKLALLGVGAYFVLQMLTKKPDVVATTARR